MHLTELLVTGYDGNDAVLAVNLKPNEAKVVLTSTNDNGETIVADAATEQATDAFAQVRGLLDHLMKAPTSIS